MALARMKEVTEIEPGLYVGSTVAASRPEILKKYRIEAVISVCDLAKPAPVVETYNDNGILHDEIMLVDIKDVRSEFAGIFARISNYLKHDIRVLVNCDTGNKRAVICCAVYILIRNYLEVKLDTSKIPKPITPQILIHLKKLRKHSAPESSFVTALNSFERELRAGKYDLSPLYAYL